MTSLIILPIFAGVAWRRRARTRRCDRGWRRGCCPAGSSTSHGPAGYLCLEQRSGVDVIVVVLAFTKSAPWVAGVGRARVTTGVVLFGVVAQLNLAVTLRAPGRNVPIGDLDVAQVPGDLGAGVRPVIRLDALNSYGNRTTQLLDEIDGRAHRRIVTDLQDAVPRGSLSMALW